MRGAIIVLSCFDAVDESALRLPEWALILIIVVGVIVVLTLSIAGFVLVACCLQRSRYV